ncbi:MAG: hypothetical protein AAF372_03445 [Pseudomonadota bacterium]
MKHIIVVMILMLSASFCSLAIADRDDDLNQKLRANGVVADDQTILVSGNVYFYPNKKGFGLLSGGKDREKGFIVFTDQGFSVVSWSRSKETYNTLYEVDYSELESSEVMGNSPMVRLVTKEKAEKKHNSFEIMDSRNAFAPNPEKTKDANKIIEAGIEGLDTTKVVGAASLTTVQAQQQQERMQELEERIKRLEEGTQGVEATEAPQSSECDCKCPE